ncbi:TPA: AAA family ATPase, partial [Neisseria meningitidis]
MKSENNYERIVQNSKKFQHSQKNEMQKRITDLLQQLTNGIHERDQIMAVSLLGAIAGHNTFLFGPPGTAKSLISRRLACAFENPQYFEYLMNRFSTPEEVFGPVSIKALKEDRYLRKIEGYLPTADFAFLDEIWKSSPAILNNLLTIINEHIFKNGDERFNVPLKALIAASNEIPPENQGLEALYDRFIIRLLVPPIEQEENFNRLLDSKPSSDKPEISEDLRISYHELAKWREQLHKVRLSTDTLLIIKYIREELAAQFDKLGVYVSDRRWQRAAVLLKASAFCNGRKETNHSDVILLKYCLWTTPENRESVEQIVMNAIKSCGFDTGIDLAELDREKESLDKEINKELYHSQDVYETVEMS